MYSVPGRHGTPTSSTQDCTHTQGPAPIRYLPFCLLGPLIAHQFSYSREALQPTTRKEQVRPPHLWAEVTLGVLDCWDPKLQESILWALGELWGPCHACRHWPQPGRTFCLPLDSTGSGWAAT